MNDRDLMIAVAKAIGGTLSEGHTQRRSLSIAGGWEWIGAPGVVTPDDWAPYPGVVIHPLQDDRDAFRLAVMRALGILHDKFYVSVYDTTGEEPLAVERIEGDRAAATRRAIVRAVAAQAEFLIPSQGT